MRQRMKPIGSSTSDADAENPAAAKNRECVERVIKLSAAAYFDKYIKAREHFDRVAHVDMIAMLFLSAMAFWMSWTYLEGRDSSVSVWSFPAFLNYTAAVVGFTQGLCTWLWILMTAKRQAYYRRGFEYYSALITFAERDGIDYVVERLGCFYEIQNSHPPAWRSFGAEEDARLLSIPELRFGEQAAIALEVRRKKYAKLDEIVKETVEMLQEKHATPIQGMGARLADLGQRLLDKRMTWGAWFGEKR